MGGHKFGLGQNVRGVDGSTTANEGMFGTAESDLDAHELTCMGAKPALTTRTLWFSYQGRVESGWHHGGVLDVGGVSVDEEDSGVSGVPGVCEQD